MKNFTYLLFALLICSCTSNTPSQKTSLENIKTVLTKVELQNKIKGGWAGQVIGCTFGGPTEFQFKGTMINDYMPIVWDENRCLWYFNHAPGLYDDVYMDLTFVDVFEKEGLDAPAKSHALAFANAGYKLWHANQAARYNILNGIMPPESGYWQNNPHSDDIDFQIEADFAGLMAPGMVNSATEICDKVGHIMNYGDGWYGGVYVAAMYSLAFVSNDVEFVVTEALKAIPQKSQFYQCVNDVIGWHKNYPDDWKRAWFEVEKKWSADVGCPEGVFRDFNIDAKINAAYVVIGLLYGNGDYSKTLEIATRCGQDSDCNPATAGGILGTILGYSNIPAKWISGVVPVEDIDFKYTTMSLNDVYKIGTKHALEMLSRNGADIHSDSITIPFQKIKPVALEIGFENHFPVERRNMSKSLNVKSPAVEFNFTGIGFALNGWAKNAGVDGDIELEITIDNSVPERFVMPTQFQTRKHEVAWKYNLENKKHKVKLRLTEPNDDFWVDLGDLIVYSKR